MFVQHHSPFHASRIVITTRETISNQLHQERLFALEGLPLFLRAI